MILDMIDADIGGGETDTGPPARTRRTCVPPSASDPVQIDSLKGGKMPTPVYPLESVGAMEMPHFTRCFSAEIFGGYSHHEAAGDTPKAHGSHGGGGAFGADLSDEGTGPSHPEPDPDLALGFMNEVFPDDEWPGHALLWILDRDSQKKRTHWFASLEAAERGIKTNANLWKTREVYLGMGMSAPGLRTGNGPGDLSPYRRLPQNQAVDTRYGMVLPNPAVHFVPGLWADIDYGEEGHKAGSGKAYPPDLETAKERLNEAPIQPTIIVRSGHGLQAFWLFDELLDVSPDRVAAANRLAGWLDLLRTVFDPYDLDPVSDLSRVMRLPGFVNNKIFGRPLLVEVISNDGPRATPDTVDLLLSSHRGSDRGRRGRKKPSAARSKEPFTFEPGSAGDWNQFQASYDNNPRFAGAWDGNRPDLKDQSASGYDMALANAAADLGWTKEETIDLLVARRQKSEAQRKPASYYERTVEKAFASKQRGENSSGSKYQRKRDANVGGRATAQKADDFAAVQGYIQEVVREEKTIYWLDEFYQIQRGLWLLQDEQFFRKRLHGVIAEARESGKYPVVSRDTIASCMQTLAVGVTPPCIDASLLNQSQGGMYIPRKRNDMAGLYSG